MMLWWCIYGIIPVLEAINITHPTNYCPDVCLCDQVITSCQNSELDVLPEGINPNVVSLDLSLNMLTQVPPGLKSFTKLKYLNLSHNHIATLGRLDFNGLVNLERLDLSFNYFHDWRDIQADALVRLEKLIFLDMSNNALRNMPKYSNCFPRTSLTILKMNNCSFSILPVNQFNNLVNLIELHLTNNPVVNLKEIFLMKNLRFLDISSCSLQNIGYDVFNNLIKLETLILSKNNLLTKFNSSSDNLLSLDLSYCSLNESPSGYMPALQTLHLQGNFIKTLSAEAFTGYPELLVLNLSLNAITEINNNGFRGLDNLKVMDLSLNKIASIEEQTLLPTISLEELNLSHNYISKLDTITSASLTKLDVSYCEIYSVSKYSLSSLVKLRILILSRNFMSSIPDQWMANNLLYLDLSGCRIRSIGNYTFKQMQYLRYIDLSDNRLSSVEPSFFPSQVRSVKLEDNQWICDCLKLKPMYQYLIDRAIGTDNLVCDSPDKVIGQKWYNACYKEWNKPKKEQLYWYAVAFIVSITLLLLILAGLRKLSAMKEKRYQEMEERRRQQERDAREALARMRRLQREYMEEDSRNAPDPRESQGPPSYSDALLMPRVDSSHTSLHGSLHSLASRGSLHGSTSDINKKGKVRRKRRRRRSETSERSRQSRITVDDSETTDQEAVNRTVPLESDF